METKVEPILSRYLHKKGRALGLPIAGTFELTARCNFNCKMCYVHLTAEEQKQRGRELTAAEWLDIARQAKDAGMVFLLLTGGEPTLRPDFPEIYRELKKMGFMISINSNGYLLQDDILKLFADDPPIRINISLYGVSDETYKNLCGVPAYARIVRNIENLRKAGVEVKINMTMTPDNMQDMEEVFQKAMELGVRTQASPYMFPPLRRDPSMVGQNMRMSPEQAGEFLTRYNLLCMDDDSFCRLAYHQKKGIAEPSDDPCEGNPGRGITCRAGSTSYWLSWDGKLMLCGQTPEPGFDVLRLGFDEAWKQLRQSAAEIRLPSECVSCDMGHLCHACAAMCYCETGRFDGKPEFICGLYRSFYRSMQQAWKEKFNERIPNASEESHGN